MTDKMTFISEYNGGSVQNTVQKVFTKDSLKWSDAIDQFIDFLEMVGYSDMTLVKISQHLNKRIFMETAAPSYYGDTNNSLVD